MRITINDRLSFPVNSQRKILDNGFLQVPGRVARTGVQQYLASELGLTDRPPNSLVNVYRPPEEVFKVESLASYDNADITVEHPSDLVDSTTFKTVSAGHAMSSGRPEGDYVIVDLLVKDQYAIDCIEKGKAELSAGYVSELIAKDGIAPDGTPYEFIQIDISINHIALCDNARAGHLARLFDNHRVENKVMPKVILDKGVEVEVADSSTQTLIQSMFDSLTKRLKDAEETAEKTEEELLAEKAKSDLKDEEIEELKKTTSEDSINRRLNEVMKTMDHAQKIAGKEFISDSLDPMKIKRAALAEIGKKCKSYDSWDKAPDIYVNAFFDAAAEEEEEKEENGEMVNDSHQKLTTELGKRMKTGDADSQRAAVRNAFLDKRYGRNQEQK